MPSSLLRLPFSCRRPNPPGVTRTSRWCRVLPLLLLTALACGDATPRPRGVILISIDTLRADRLGCYGYERPTTPSLDRLAAAGTLFENCVAQAPWTLPAHATMLTGLAPHRHGVVRRKHRLGT